mmetsp:Transcript_42894/g.121211  ORF Transcript_42894/g.121211 Transcript_42894/m.121211 type:complete len:201 (-) Transcript_42894:1304-1906(-)
MRSVRISRRSRCNGLRDPRCMWRRKGQSDPVLISDVVLLLVVPHAVQKQEAQTGHGRAHDQQEHVGLRRSSGCEVFDGFGLFLHTYDLPLARLGELRAALRLQILGGLLHPAHLLVVNALGLHKDGLDPDDVAFQDFWLKLLGLEAVGLDGRQMRGHIRSQGVESLLHLNEVLLELVPVLVTPLDMRREQLLEPQDSLRL